MLQQRLKSNASWLAILATQGVICAGAAADPITLTETIDLNQALTAGNGSATGLFDINSLLPTTGNYAAPLNLISATVSVYGYSNPQANQIVSGYSAYQQTGQTNYYYTYYQLESGYYYYYYISGYYAYYCGWGDTCYYTNYAEGEAYYYYYSPETGYATVTTETAYNTVTNLDNTTDTAAVTAGADTLTASDQETVTNFGSTTAFQSSSSSGGGSTSYYYQTNYYTSTDTIDDYISGALSATEALSAASLALLSENGQLSYSVDASSGQFELTQLTLTVTLDQSVAVPEPGSLSVFGFGLLLLALRARSLKRPPNIDTMSS
jgi:hypothetical protein